MIELPWFPKELAPNAKRRSHWRRYAPIAARYRRDCHMVALAHGYRPGKGLRIASVTFYPPDRRRRDDDGMIGGFKSGRDGIADALGTDDHAYLPSYHFGEPVSGGKIVVVLR